MAKKKIKRKNRYFNTYDGGGLLGKFADWNEKLTKDFMGDTTKGIGKAFNSLGITSSNIGGIANTAAGAVGSIINPSGNSTKVGNAMQTIGGLASNIPGVGGMIGAGISMAGGLYNAAFGSNLNEAKIAEVENQIDSLKSFESNAGDFDALSANYASAPAMANFSKGDIGSDGWFSNKAEDKYKELKAEQAYAENWVRRSLANNAENIATTNQQLMEANYTAFGGPIRMRYTGTMSPFGNRYDEGGGIYIKPSKRGTFTAAAKKHGKSVQAFASQVLANKDNYSPAMVKKANFARNAGKWHSFGGWLNSQGGDFTNGVTFIDNGGSHEENPFEGVQMGIDPQGVPNLVEEGEVIFNDYVFSDRMKLPKKLKEKYSIKGETFADAAKELSRESEERPNDPISQRGLEAFMSALTESQEEVRIKNEDRRMNRYAKGGKLGNLFDGTGNRSNRLNPYSNFVPLTDDSFYTPEYMDFWNWYNTNQNTPEGQAWLKRINSGEFGPIGGNTFAPQDIIRLSHDYKKGPVHNAFAAAAKQYNVENPKEAPYTPYTKRWIREKGADGEWRTQQITDEEWNSAPAGRTYLMRNPNLKEGNTITSDKGDKDIYYDVIPETFSETVDDEVKNVEGIKESPLMYAPIIGSGLAVMNDIFGGNKPDYSNADLFAGAIRNAGRQVRNRPIGDYLTYTPFDRDFYINKANAQAAASRRLAQNTAGGNRAAALTGILAADYNYGQTLGDLARQAEEYNLEQRQKVKDFNRATNMFNSEQGTKVDMFNSELLGKQASLYGQLASMRQGILERNRAEKSANLTNFIQGLGDLGKYLTDKDKLRWLADIGAISYNTKGQFTGGNNTAAPIKRSKGGRIRRKGYTI